MPKRLFITVGEVSGDNHAAGLIASLKKLDPTLTIDAVGGPAMAAAGATVHFETTTKAAMSFHAVKRVAEIRRLETWLRARYAAPATRPDLHVCVDSSGFNLRFAKLAKAAGVPTLYYVAPQLWASREGRIRQMRASVDRLACIFPFEEKWFRDRGVSATFVGHPLFDQLPADRLARVPAVRFPDRPPVIGVVAGSRVSEVRENLPPLTEVMWRILAAHPGASFLLPVTPAAAKPTLDLLHAAKIFPDWAHGCYGEEPAGWMNCSFDVDAFDAFIPQCDLVLCKSGTSTVHVAAYGVPMVVVYRISTLLWQAAGRWLIKTPKIAMVNILANGGPDGGPDRGPNDVSGGGPAGTAEIVREFIPWNGDPAPVAAAALALLADPAKLAAMRTALLDLIRPLDRRGASDNVAALAIAMLTPPAKVARP